MKDMLFIIVPNYNNEQDYIISDSDINNDENDIAVSSNMTYLIKNYEPNALLNTLNIFENQNIENVIGLSLEGLINLISSLIEEKNSTINIINENLENK